MSVPALAWAFEYDDLPLDGRTGKPQPTCKAVLIALAWHASPTGTDAFPSNATLCDHTCLSENTVRAVLQALEDHGVIGRTPDPLIRSATIRRGDRRPTSWDLLPMRRGPKSATDEADGVQSQSRRGPNSDVTGSKLEGDFGPDMSLKEPQDKTPGKTPNPLSDEKSSDVRSRTRDAGAGARAGQVKTGHDEGGDQFTLLEVPGPVEAVVSITAQRDASFERFWEIYPRKTSKAAARRAWNRAMDTTTLDKVLGAVAVYAQSRRGDDQRFTKHPATWLNGGCWDDEAPVGNARSGSGDRLGSRHRPYQDQADESVYQQKIN